MSIQLNYNVSKSARPGANVFSQPLTKDVSGLQRAGQAIGQLGQAAGKIAEVYDAQDKSAQNLLGMKAYSALTEDVNLKASNLESAIANGNNDAIKLAQDEFDSLKDKSILDYIPQDSAGVEITRDSVLTNYGTQYTQLYGGLSRKLEKQKGSQYAKNVIFNETKEQETDYTGLIVKYGKNPIPLEEVQTYTNKHFNLEEDTEAYNALPSDTLKEAYAKNKLELFNLLLNKSLTGVKTEADLDNVRLSYDTLFGAYEIFRNIPGASEDYQNAIQAVQDNIDENKLEFAKENAEEKLDLAAKSLDTQFKSDTLATSNTSLLALDNIAALVETGVPGVDYTILEDIRIFQDFTKVDPDNYLESDFTKLLKVLARTPTDQRPDVSQYFGAQVDGELAIVFPELLQISSDNKTKLENHITSFIEKFDTLMEEGDGMQAMASIDPYVQKLLKDGKAAEANLYIQNEYIDKGVFAGRNFPAFFADISTEGFDNDTDVNEVKKRAYDLITKNVNNYEALYNNVKTRQSKGGLEESVANMYTLMETILPFVVEKGFDQTALDGLINDIVEPQRQYAKGSEEDKAKIDDLFKLLADYQLSYHTEEAGDSIFGEIGLRNEIQLMNLYAEGSVAQREFAENFVKGYLYQEIIENKKTPKEAVKSLQDVEQEKMSGISPTIVETYGETFSVALPAEANDIILKGKGENQFTGLREFWYSVSGNQEELEKSKRAEVARNYGMTTIALYAMSGMEVSQFQSYLKAFGLERSFKLTDPVFYNSNTGKPTREGLKAIIKGIMTNDVEGVSIAKLSGHSYAYDNGQLKKYPRLAFKSGTGYTEVETPQTFDVNDVLEVVKAINLGDNVIYDLRFPGGRGGEALDRLLDILEETGIVSDLPDEQLISELEKRTGL